MFILWLPNLNMGAGGSAPPMAISITLDPYSTVEVPQDTDVELDPYSTVAV